MNDKTFHSAVDSDLGITRKTPAMIRNNPTRTDLTRAAADIQQHTASLLDQSAPETLGQKVLDALVPSPIRAAKRRGEVKLVEVEVEARVDLLKTVRAAQIAQMQAAAETYSKAAELQATEEIAMHGIETASKVDQEIERSGEVFDRALDDAVQKATALKSESAKHSAADRIERRKAMRAKVEDAAMDAVRNAVTRTRYNTE